MKDKRPVYLSVNPLQFNFPIAALASIAHRISGVLLLVALGYFLYLLALALPSPAGFEEARAMLSEPIHQVVLFLCMSAVIYHFILGVKHILLDFHIADTLAGSRRLTIACLAIFVVCEGALGVWIWQ